MAKKIIQKEGVSVGMSSGAVMWVAKELSKQIQIPSRIVIIFPDRAEKYVSTILFK